MKCLLTYKYLLVINLSSINYLYGYKVAFEKEKIKSVACEGDTGNIHPSVS